MVGAACPGSTRIRCRPRFDQRPTACSSRSTRSATTPSGARTRAGSVAGAVTSSSAHARSIAISCARLGSTPPLSRGRLVGRPFSAQHPEHPRCAERCLARNAPCPRVPGTPLNQSDPDVPVESARGPRVTGERCLAAPCVAPRQRHAIVTQEDPDRGGCGAPGVRVAAIAIGFRSQISAPQPPGRPRRIGRDRVRHRRNAAPGTPSRDAGVRTPGRSSQIPWCTSWTGRRPPWRPRVAPS